MASFKIQVVDPQQSISFNARYERLDKDSNTKVEIVAKAPNGKEVKERSFMNGAPLLPGSTTRQWVDEDGTVYGKSELTFYHDGSPVSEVQQSKVFTIEGYQSVQNYTDKYCISAYYEVFPDDNGMKKDIDKQISINANLRGLRQLWDFLRAQNAVARGVFCPTSRGFVESDGYIRAIEIEGKWGLEIGQFKQEKVFLHLNEGLPTEVKMQEPVKATRIRKI